MKSNGVPLVAFRHEPAEFPGHFFPGKVQTVRPQSLPHRSFDMSCTAGKMQPPELQLRGGHSTRTSQ